LGFPIIPTCAPCKATKILEFGFLGAFSGQAPMGGPKYNTTFFAQIAADCASAGHFKVAAGDGEVDLGLAHKTKCFRLRHP